MAGGYGADIDDTVAVHLRTLLEASRSARSGGRARAAGGPRFDGTIAPHERPPVAEPRSAYRFQPASPRAGWTTILYGHINNVVYYSFFDTVVNGYLIDRGALDIHGGAVIGLVVETQCNYFTSLQYPQAVDAGIGWPVGASSVRYEIGLFAERRAPARLAGTSCTCTSSAAVAGRSHCPQLLAALHRCARRHP